MGNGLNEPREDFVGTRVRVKCIKTTYTLAERVGSRKKNNPRLMFTTIYFNETTN